MSAAELFTEPALKMTAVEVKDCLRRQYPATQVMGVAKIPGPWVTVEEWRQIDLLAIGVTRHGTKYEWIGHEIKVSRSDMRTDLLKPDKREAYKAYCHRLYYVVPQGLLTADELSWNEPEWQDGDFERQKCDAACVQRRGDHGYSGPFYEPIPYSPNYADLMKAGSVKCGACNGKGYTAKSRVESEAPTLWVPRDTGLIEIKPRGGRKVVKTAPKHGLSDDMERHHVADLVRWSSARPDPRHDGVVERARLANRKDPATNPEADPK